MFFFIVYVVVYSVFIPIVAGLVTFKKHQAPARALFYFILFSGATDVVVGQFTLRNIDTTPGLHFYTVAELMALSVFFYRLLASPLKKRAIVITAIAFVALSLINTIYFQPLTVANTYTRSLEALIIIACCFMYFEQESRIRQSVKWEKKPANWFVAGLLVYFAGSFFFFLFSNIITNLAIPAQNVIWCLHGAMQIIMYLLITIGYRNERSN